MARILVVNDTQVLLEMFQLLLEEEGYEVILSAFPTQQVKEIEHINPDLIILDLLFGKESSGWQMLQMLKMYRPTRKIPVIICTAALEDVREQEGYLNAQGVKVIYKPFDLDDFLDTIKQALSKPPTATP